MILLCLPLDKDRPAIRYYRPRRHPMAGAFHFRAPLET